MILGLKGSLWSYLPRSPLQRHRHTPQGLANTGFRQVDGCSGLALVAASACTDMSCPWEPTVGLTDQAGVGCCGGTVGTWAAAAGLGAAGVGVGVGTMTVHNPVERCKGTMQGGSSPACNPDPSKAQRASSKHSQKGSCLGKPRPSAQGPDEGRGTWEFF